MGRKTNSNSLRIKKTNKDYNDCWYGDILYSAHFSRSLKIQKSLCSSLNNADISSQKYSLIGAQKRADILLCYLDPKVRKQGCDKYNIKFHVSVSKNFRVKKKKDQNVTSVPLPISSFGHIQHDALPTLLSRNQWPHAWQSTDTPAFFYKSKPKHKQQEQSLFIKQTSSAFTGSIEAGKKGLFFHARSLGCGSQNPIDLERFFFPATRNSLWDAHTAQGTKASSLHGNHGAPTSTSKVSLLSPHKKQKESKQCQHNNILTFKDSYKKAHVAKNDSTTKAFVLHDDYSKVDVKKPLQGNNSIQPLGYLQNSFFPHLQSFSFEKKLKKSPFFSFLMGICGFRKNFYITGKNVNFFSPIADVSFHQKQGVSFANNTKEYCFSLQHVKKGISEKKEAQKDHADYPIEGLFANLDCALLTPLHSPLFLDKREKQAYIWNLSHCYTDFWGSFLSLCFIKSNHEKASAHFLCGYVSYFLERKVLFRTIKQQLSASLNAFKQKKTRI